MSRLVHPDRAAIAPRSASAFRYEAFRRAVAALPCQCCGIWNHSQAAHANLSNMGKGRGIKASDGALMALCATRPGDVGCHVRLDQLIGMTADEAEQNTHRWIASTYIALIEAGALKVSK
jgi:hypothetical protein